jgi:hypothetical protein
VNDENVRIDKCTTASAKANRPSSYATAIKFVVAILFLSQVRQGFEQLVTSLNNADTLVTLVVPSALIVFSNVRISYALTQFYRTRQSFDGNASVFGGSLPSPPSSTASSTVRRSILRQGSCRTGQRAVDADQRVSFNHLQLKVNSRSIEEF